MILQDRTKPYIRYCGLHRAICPFKASEGSVFVLQGNLLQYDFRVLIQVLNRKLWEWSQVGKKWLTTKIPDPTCCICLWQAKKETHYKPSSLSMQLSMQEKYTSGGAPLVVRVINPILETNQSFILLRLISQEQTAVHYKFSDLPEVTCRYCINFGRYFILSTERYIINFEICPCLINCKKQSYIALLQIYLGSGSKGPLWCGNLQQRCLLGSDSCQNLCCKLINNYRDNNNECRNWKCGKLYIYHSTSWNRSNTQENQSYVKCRQNLLHSQTFRAPGRAD